MLWNGAASKDTRAAYLADCNVTKRAALKGGKPWWIYFNAADFLACDDPTATQMAWQIYAALAYGSRGVMYFFYANPAPPCNRPFLWMAGIVDTDGKPSQKYYQAKEINSKVVALGPTLMQLDSVDVLEVSWLQTNAQIEAQLHASTGCGLVSLSHYYYTIGCFLASGDSAAKLTPSTPALAKGTRAVMIVNREHAHTALANVTFDVEMSKVTEIDQSTGQQVAVVDYAPEMGGIQLHFGPGAGRLFVLPAAGLVLKSDDGEVRNRLSLIVPQVIVLAPGATAVEKLAAAELARLLPPLISGNRTISSVPIVTGFAADHGAANFAVGHGAAMAMGAMGWNLSGAVPEPSSTDPFKNLGNDSYTILSARCGGAQPKGVSCSLPLPHLAYAGTVFITGCKGCVRGALYGVYELLRLLGIKFLAGDETLYPANSTLPIKALPVFNMSYTPSYEYRDILGWPVMNDPVWAAQLGINGPSVWDGFLTPIDPQFKLASVQYANPPGFVHTALRLLDDLNGTHGNVVDANVPPELRKLHPEWFSLNESRPGKLRPCAKGGDASGTYLDGCQLCWSSPSLQQFMLKQVMMFLRAKPDATVLSISNMDNANKCIRPDELAIVEEEGSDAAPILRAVNFIAAGIESEFPHVSIDLLAYSYATDAPTKTHARQNVIVRMALGQNHAAPASDMTNKNFTDIISGCEFDTASALFASSQTTD